MSRGIVSLDGLVFFLCGSVGVGHFYERGNHGGAFGRMLCGMFRDNFKISSVMPCSRLRLALFLHGLRKIELRVGLRGIGRNGALPTVNRLAAVPKPVREQA